MIVIGANVSSAGGVLQTLPRAKALGVQAIQFFASSPRSWQRRVISTETAKEFREGLLASGFELWIHGSYLMNFATDKPVALEQARQSLTQDLADCAALGGKGVIFHLGSHRGRGVEQVIEQIIQTLGAIAESTSEVNGYHLRGENGQPWIVIENSAGMGGSIGSKLEELGQIVKRLPEDRAKVCLDTQHLFAAGYPIHEEKGMARFIEDFDREVGLARLVALHCNDSKIAFGGGVDRHANISEGEIGEAGIQVITHHAKLQNLPFLLEVPGVDHAGPDKANVDRLRRIAQS